MKRLLVRVFVIFGFVLFGIWLAVFGKGHTLILDNKTVTVDGRTYEPPAGAEVSLNGGKGLEILARERDKTELKGPFHRIAVKVLDKNSKVLTIVEKKFSLGGKDMYLLSIPALVGGAGTFVEEFLGMQAPPPDSGRDQGERPQESSGNPEQPKM